MLVFLRGIRKPLIWIFRAAGTACQHHLYFLGNFGVVLARGV